LSHGSIYARFHPELEVIQSGFLDPGPGFDRATWQLFQRRDGSASNAG
jgi:hypothetical protein